MVCSFILGCGDICYLIAFLVFVVIKECRWCICAPWKIIYNQLLAVMRFAAMDLQIGLMS